MRGFLSGFANVGLQMAGISLGQALHRALHVSLSIIVTKIFHILV
jgi:hypothetical protein